MPRFCAKMSLCGHMRVSDAWRGGLHEYALVEFLAGKEKSA
jgi:hypothetical protein